MPRVILKFAGAALALGALAATDAPPEGPDDAALVARGDDCRLAGDYDAALAWYGDALARDPNAPGAVAGAAASLAARDEEATVAFLADAYTAPAVIFPPPARALLAEGWARRGAVAKARELLTVPEGFDAGELYFVRGRIYLAAGDLPRAIEDLNKANAAGEETAAYWLGEALLAAGRNGEAETALTAFMTDYPYVAAAYAARGETYYRRGDGARAARDFRTALNYDGADARALFDLATLAARDRDYGGALRYYGRVLELDPWNEEAWLRVIGVYAHVDTAVARAKREEYERLFGKKG